MVSGEGELPQRTELPHPSSVWRSAAKNPEDAGIEKNKRPAAGRPYPMTSLRVLLLLPVVIIAMTEN